MDTFVILLLFITLLVCILFLRRICRLEEVIFGKPLPGPKPLPILGNVLSVGLHNLHISLWKLVEQYGALFQISVLGQTIVIISDADLIKKAFGSDTEHKYGDVFNDKPGSFWGKYFAFNYADIGFGKTNPKTMMLRKIWHRALRNYGDGISLFEENSELELKRLLEELRNTKGNDFAMNDTIRKSFANTTVSLLTGEQADENEHQLIWEFIVFCNGLMEPGVATFYEMFPFIRLFPGKFGNLYKKAIGARNIFMERYYFRIKDALAKGEGVDRGFVQKIIRLQQENNKRNTSVFIGEDNMKALIVDMVFAGTVTTTLAIGHSLALVIAHPHVAKKIQEEIDNVVGDQRMPKLSDRARMPYTVATVFEVLRYTAAIAPSGFPHRALEETNFEGYFIPKGSTILTYAWYVLHDPQLWNDPWLFDPSRFLDATGNLLPPEHEARRNFVAFSTGRRDCPGKTFAKSRMFLYLATVLQSFDLMPGSAGELPDTDPHNYVPGINLEVKRYKCRAFPRT